jgi:hypothetical protein
VRTKSRLESLRPITAGTLAALCGINPATLSNGLRGITRIAAEAERALAETSLALQEIADAAAPFLLPNDVNQLARLLEHVRENGVTAEQIREHVSAIFGSNVEQQ